MQHTVGRASQVPYLLSGIQDCILCHISLGRIFFSHISITFHTCMFCKTDSLSQIYCRDCTISRSPIPVTLSDKSSVSCNTHSMIHRSDMSVLKFKLGLHRKVRLPHELLPPQPCGKDTAVHFNPGPPGCIGRH